MKILDLSAGNRAIWFDKTHPLATFLDKRPEVGPTIVCDTRKLPDSVGTDYDLVCWDPPHMNCGPNSNMSKVYGYHTTAEILDTIEKTAAEAYRVTKPTALMAFKWNNHDISLPRVLFLMPQWEPLFGHLTKDGPGSQTYWVMLRRISEYELETFRLRTEPSEKFKKDMALSCDRAIKQVSDSFIAAGIIPQSYADESDDD